MKTILLLAALGTTVLIAALCAGCQAGGHTVCYEGRCVHWTNTPPAISTNAP